MHWNPDEGVEEEDGGERQGSRGGLVRSRTGPRRQPLFSKGSSGRRNPGGKSHMLLGSRRSRPTPPSSSTNNSTNPLSVFGGRKRPLPEGETSENVDRRRTFRSSFQRAKQRVEERRRSEMSSSEEDVSSGRIVPKRRVHAPRSPEDQTQTPAETDVPFDDSLPTIDTSVVREEEEEGHSISEEYGKSSSEESDSSASASSSEEADDAQKKEKEKTTSIGAEERPEPREEESVPLERSDEQTAPDSMSDEPLDDVSSVQNISDFITSKRPQSKKTNGKKPSRSSRRKPGLRTIVRLPVHQRKAINLVRDSLGYGDLQLSEEYRDGVSKFVNIFAEKVFVASKDLLVLSKKQQLTFEAIQNAITALVPYGPLLFRMQNEMKAAHERFSVFVLDEAVDKQIEEENGKRARTSLEKKCGLHISISSLRNLAKQKVPHVSGINAPDPFVILAAAMEVLMQEILTRSVGVLMAESMSTGTKQTLVDEEEETEAKHTIPTTWEGLDGENEPVFKKSKMRTTLTKDDLNVAVHFTTSADMVRCYSSNRIYSHRRTSYEKELEKEEERNERRNARMKRKRRTMKTVARERALDTNQRGLLHPQEVVSYMVHDNTLALLFKDTKLLHTSNMVNIREGVLPERMKKRARHFSEGEGVSAHPRVALRTLQYMWSEFAESKDASLWMRNQRK